ncbi:MAG: IS1595 family transposase [Methyloligella sp. ZOD6]
MSNLSAPHFHDEQAAYQFVEARIWPEGPICPHCGGTERISPMKGKSTRIGAYKCYQCRKPFTVKIGTIFEASNVKMHVWLQAIYLMAASKKGISTHQLHRTLGVALRTAWFMSHRIREAMREGALDTFGTGGGIVEADETFIGNDRTKKPKGQKKGRGYHHKHKVLALVDRTTRRARTMVIDSLAAKDIAPILRENVAKEARLMTDEASYYTLIGREFASHDIVRHGQGEYGRGEIGTNTIEGFFSVFKRGMKGIYQHCGKSHLHRYAAEFEFRYNHRVANGFDDLMRADRLLVGFKGKRLMYRDSFAG